MIRLWKTNDALCATLVFAAKFVGVIAFVGAWVLDASATQPWQLEKLVESSRVSINGLHLNAAADLNGNGRKEIVVADFGEYGEAIAELRPELHQYNLFVIEWEPSTSSLSVKWKKHWDGRKVSGADEARFFSAWKASELIALPRKNGNVVETIPPYLSLEFRNGNYVLNEQHDPKYKSNATGSWVFPWQRASCHPKTKWTDYPRECLLAIRDFFRDGTPRILTYWAEPTEYFEKPGGPPIPKKFKVLLRVRKWAPGFPIEWEQKHPTEVHGAVFVHEQDHLNWRLHSGFVIGDQLTYAEARRRDNKIPMHFFDPDPNGKGYRLRLIEAEWPFPNDTGRGYYPDIHMGYTRDRKVAESWGYVRESGPAVDEFYTLVLRRAVLRDDLKGWETEELKFPHHEQFLGIGHFQLTDLDGDGLDEIILVEQTGKRTPAGGSERPFIKYTVVKDYIRILRWNGKGYEAVWTSPPYTVHGTKLLIDDVKGNGKKQLVVLNMHGTVEIWERK